MPCDDIVLGARIAGPGAFHTPDVLASVHLSAQGGATVLVHGRNKDKAQKAADRVKSSSGSANVHALAADLSSLEQVRSCGYSSTSAAFSCLLSGAFSIPQTTCHASS